MNDAYFISNVYIGIRKWIQNIFHDQDVHAYV